MFGLGVPEIVIIGIVAIVVFGPKRIPELGSALGKTLRSFREEMDNPDTEDEEFFDGDEDDRP
ncbi:MAG: twin-arginine translocase TatA/TatE family subunit [Phormidesmis priestleyi]|uniref:Sec-independent protein translocase protein TatA n=1 Tax=Phormidesmis priestleyi TaxID=268141 RepID=A0A2W4Z4Y8_9CYAN|nr:MAG: twin-arginine translocase TatA/TatE family subunit [Phormidesmis priestleyi]